MKHFRTLIAIGILLLVLTACRADTAATEPVWQTTLPNTGISVQISGCTVEETTTPYWDNADASGEALQMMLLHAASGAPVLEVDTPKAQVDIQFAQPISDGMAAYDLALPVEQVDMVFLTPPEEAPTRVRFDTIYNFIVTVKTDFQTDQFLIACSRDGYGIDS